MLSHKGVILDEWPSPGTIFETLGAVLGGGIGSDGGGLGSCAGFLSIWFWGASVASERSKACGFSSEAGRLAFSRSSVEVDVFLAEETGAKAAGSVGYESKSDDHTKQARP